MNTFKNSSQLKAKAKGVLLGKYGTAISAFLFIEAITFLIQIIVSSVTNTKSVAGMIIYYCALFIIELIVGIFAFGQTRLYMNMSCNFPYSVNDIFYGFKNHPDKIITIQFLIMLISAVYMLPTLLLWLLYEYLQIPVLLLLVSVVSIMSGICICVTLLSYSQVNYLILDFPQYSALEIMSMSKKLMKGYKGHLFYLIVSFIPLILLSLITCCIGYLWIMPYMNATTTQFYLELIRVKSSS